MMQQTQHNPEFLRLIDDAKSRIQEISADDVKAKLDRGDKFFLVDVREDREWNIGHLPQAMHLSRGILERDIHRHITDLNADIVLYCAVGFRSAMSADNLEKMGYRQVCSMAGGWNAWKDLGYAVADSLESKAPQ